MGNIGNEKTGILIEYTPINTAWMDIIVNKMHKVFKRKTVWALTKNRDFLDYFQYIRVSRELNKKFQLKNAKNPKKRTNPFEIPTGSDENSFYGVYLFISLFFSVFSLIFWLHGSVFSNDLYYYLIIFVSKFSFFCIIFVIARWCSKIRKTTVSPDAYSIISQKNFITGVTLFIIYEIMIFFAPFGIISISA